MAEKKDRGRFTLRLNEKDPAHAEVIRVLEQQDPHSKGRFIANAVLHYIHCDETPDISVQQAIPNKADIEAIVLEILQQQNTRPGTQSPAPPSAPEEHRTVRLPEPAAEQDSESEADEGTRNLIKSALSAFRSNN